MKVSDGFVVACSTNLPKVDSFMLLELMSTSDKYNASEIRGAKAFLSTRTAYVDNAVGYVELKREGDLCVVNARVTPEHRVKSTAYKVTVTINEEKESLVDAECHSCAASEGGCKHSLCLLMWLNRRTEEPSVTDVIPYWKKPRLAEAVVKDKFVLARDIGNPSSSTIDVQVPNIQSFLNQCQERNITDCLVLNYRFRQNFRLTNLTIFNLALDFVTECDNNDRSYHKFNEYCKQKMDSASICAIQEKTQGQSDSKLWHSMRQGRITASTIHKASRCTTDGSLVKSILGGYKVPETQAIKRGKRLEHKVIEELEKDLKVKIEKSGLILINPIIGASPDGLTENYVVEIKCPSKERTMQLYVKDGVITDTCRAQIMTQMLATKKQRGLLCMADPKFEHNKKLYKFWIKYVQQYMCGLLKLAEEFWIRFIFDKMLESVQ